MEQQSATTRRKFLQSSAAAMATIRATTAAQAQEAGVHTGVDETLRIGLVGCGNRGRGAVGDALTADPQAVLVAVGDVFPDQADRCVESLRRQEQWAERIRVDTEHVFTDFDNYRGVIDACDLVLLATPPHFRPQHLQYAVEQGKHVFVEKPVAVDAPGLRSVELTCQLARHKGLSLVSGLCWRYDWGVRETIRQILEERRIGDLVAIESSYNTGTLWHRGDKPHWSRMEYQIRNWLYHTWLSGDHIVEQAVHSLDKTAWLLGDIQPTRAMALGGRQQRTDPQWGNIYDHFTVFYEYPTGQHVYFTCRQQAKTTTRVDERVLGTDGQALVLANEIHPRSGEAWKYAGPRISMYLSEHQELFRSIREGQPRNDGHYMCHSTMLAIMGRMAAYTGQTLTWDECHQSLQRLGPLEYAWTDVAELPVAIPGR